MNIICYLSLTIVLMPNVIHATHISPTLVITIAMYIPIYVCFFGCQECQEAAPHLEYVIWYTPIYSPSHQPLSCPPIVIIPHLCLSLCGQAWQEGVHHGHHINRCIPICYPSLNFSQCQLSWFPLSPCLLAAIPCRMHRISSDLRS